MIVIVETVRAEKSRLRHVSNHMDGRTVRFSGTNWAFNQITASNNQIDAAKLNDQGGVQSSWFYCQITLLFDPERTKSHKWNIISNSEEQDKQQEHVTNAEFLLVSRWKALFRPNERESEKDQRTRGKDQRKVGNHQRKFSLSLSLGVN